MKKQLYLLVVISILITSCGPTSKLTKSQAYPEIYKQKPLAVLIMPPINRSTAVEAKEYFHTTLNVPIANAGYYVIPPFLSMEILKRESAYDSELFIDRPSLEIFRDIFGAYASIMLISKKYWEMNKNVSIIIPHNNMPISQCFMTRKVVLTLFYSRGYECIKPFAHCQAVAKNGFRYSWWTTF